MGSVELLYRRICLHCRKAKCRGVCRCGVTGRPIDEQVAAAACPLGFFARRLGLGDRVAVVLIRLGLDRLFRRLILDIRRNNAWLMADDANPVLTCGCDRRRVALNTLGLATPVKRT